MAGAQPNGKFRLMMRISAVELADAAGDLEKITGGGGGGGGRLAPT